MAEQVRRRFSAARAGVMMAIFGLGAGLGIRVGVAPETHVDADPAASKTLTVIGHNKVNSTQVKDHSLLFKDLKLNQVPSYKEYKAFFLDTASKFLKIAPETLLHKGEAYVKGEADARFYIKGESVDVAKKADSAGTADTAKKADNALKLNGLGSDDVVQGHGGVITGNLILGNSDADVMILIGLLRAQAKDDVQGAGPTVTLTNTSGQPMTVNENGNSQTVAPNGTHTFTLSAGTVRNVQVVTQDAKHVATLSFSWGALGQSKQMVAQALIGLL